MTAGPAEVWRQRLHAQLLAGPPARSAEAVTERLLAVQAQDPRGFRLAIRSRTTGLHRSDVDRAIDGRRIVVSWLNRGTLHLVPADDFFWLHALVAPRITSANATRLRQLGLGPRQADRGVAAIVRALDSGPLSRARLRDAVDAVGVPTAGQALVHLLLLATLRGHVVRGPTHGHEQSFVLVRDWLGEPPAVDRDRALAELARRFLRGHGPASERDLARWAGLTLRDARAGLRAIADELADPADGLVTLRTAVRRTPPLPPPRLLGAYDPVLLGWTSREQVLDRPQSQRIVTVNGLFRPFAMVGGRAVATWSYRDGRVELQEFEEIDDADRRALDDDAAAVTRFLS
jgi:hypothetical protein